MNNICITCDTRKRLGLCNGKYGSFKYCFRKSGSLDSIVESIQPFNELKELQDNSFLDWILKESLYMIPYGDNMNLLMGKYIDYEGTKKDGAVGFITK